MVLINIIVLGTYWRYSALAAVSRHLPQVLGTHCRYSVLTTGTRYSPQVLGTRCRYSVLATGTRYSLQVLGEEVPTAVGPGPRVGVVVQHARHGVLGLVLAHVRLALEVVIVRDIQTVKEEKETSERRKEVQNFHLNWHLYTITHVYFQFLELLAFVFHD